MLQTQITSNGDIDDAWIHKCFPLGLSWFWTNQMQISCQVPMKPLQRPRTELFCSHSYLRSMLTSCQSQHRIYLKDDTRHRAVGKRWERRTFVTVITLTLALTCPLISVSATCWGSFNWLVHMNRCKESRIKSCYNCHNSALVEANRLRLPQMEAVMMFKFISASLWGCLGPV